MSLRTPPDIPRRSHGGPCWAASVDVPPPAPDVVPPPPAPPVPRPPEIIEPPLPGRNEPVRDPLVPSDVDDGSGVGRVLH